MSINEIVAAYIAAKETESAAKKQAEEMKNLILDYAGNNDNFTTDLYTVVVKTTASTRLDTAALYKDFPDIKTVYGKTTASKSITAVATAAEKKSA